MYIPNKCQDDASVAALIEQEQILIEELQSGHDIMQASRALGDNTKEMKKTSALAQLLSVSERDFDIELTPSHRLESRYQ